ncbi:MAG: hypothetical protein A2015_16625 [Spirochaetes bacterium GWF1_31_7]|nr:MAG: hypothetical protein A2Y30_13990 [Spirochaetes bacterium GWE1_32_154]OHD50067.1 MAG: hypothetical protein A2Y29_12035 [Spirochaetes bacterium GWE2_31_10]OHD52381.1 MAG: hypothetical protein A2015_16625 [Spirochaetes bacterium GWF1_31_7]HBD96024.1 hypothetical protein [Spirochaetia bacterium]HBI38536.1 hypothetical protein [Spirochaetia bacterium]
MKLRFFAVFLILSLVCVNAQEIDDDPLGLSQEYSMDYFELGIRALHASRYELAISEFIKSLSYKDNNSYSRLYLGEAYKKGGYEKNALYTWNTLMSMGYESRFLKSRVSYLYNRRGMLSDIYIDKNFVIRTELKGYYERDSFTSFLNPSQLAVDKNNKYFIASFTTGSVIEMDTNLQIVRTIITANPPLGKPFGVAVATDGDILVSDFQNDRIVKINRYNIVTQTIGFKGIGEGGLLGPQYLTTDEYGNIFVVDSGNVRINKYSKDGIALFSIGRSGTGKLEAPAGMYYSDGELMVADKKRDEIVVYDESGNYLRSFGNGYLKTPYDITRDKIGRYIIVCEKEVWIYEPDSGLWYVMDAVGSRLNKGVSVISDYEDNIILSDYNRSTVYVLSLERRRYNNMYVNVEKVISNKYPDIHLFVRAEKDDMTVPVGITDNNITVFENNKIAAVAGMGYTDLLNDTSDISIIYDNNRTMLQYNNEFKTILNKWMHSIKGKTSVSLTQANEGISIIDKPLGSTRLELLDAIDTIRASTFTDKGDMFKKVSYDMIDRFSKKNIIFVTNGEETGNDFNLFKIEDVIQFALHNDIKIFVVAFKEGRLSSIYKNMADRTGGDYFVAYKRKDLKDLFTRIETTRSNYLVVSYVSNSLSRFGREPVRVEVEINYSGMKGLGDTIYFPPRK